MCSHKYIKVFSAQTTRMTQTSCPSCKRTLCFAPFRDGTCGYLDPTVTKHDATTQTVTMTKRFQNSSTQTSSQDTVISENEWIEVERKSI